MASRMGEAESGAERVIGGDERGDRNDAQGRLQRRRDRFTMD